MAFFELALTEAGGEVLAAGTGVNFGASLTRLDTVGLAELATGDFAGLATGDFAALATVGLAGLTTSGAERGLDTPVDFTIEAPANPVGLAVG